MIVPTPEEQRKQILYRDARRTDRYDDIWQSVGKCVFCDLREKYIFHEENSVVMTVSLFAYIDGQFMIIPRRHIRSVKELTQLEWETIRKFMYTAKKLIRDVHDIKGMQFILRDGGIEAQSTVNQHLHIQCTPFDAPDLSVWNYRRLKYTPLENAELYKKARQKIVQHNKKFAKKYKNQTSLPIYCDAIITNSANEILFMERASNAELQQNYITQPGGRTENYSTTLETELCREVFEETGLKTEPQDFTLINSQLDHLTYTNLETFTLIRNTYRLKKAVSGARLIPGDDCKELLWLSVRKAMTHPRISPETKSIIKKVFEAHG